MNPTDGRGSTFRTADALAEESQNALLKTLEEPPPYAHLLLISSEPEALLETVRSRCQTVRFTALRRRLIEQLKNFEHTKIIASHDLDMAVDVCERAIVIHQGNVTADGPTLELLQDEVLLEKSGLEKPLQMQNCPICGQSNAKADKSRYKADKSYSDSSTLTRADKGLLLR